MKSLALLLLTKLGVTLKGPIGWLASLILDKIILMIEKNIRVILKNFQETLRQKRQEKIDEQNQNKYNEVIKPDGKPTQQEIDDATSDLLNGRNH